MNYDVNLVDQRDSVQTSHGGPVEKLVYFKKKNEKKNELTMDIFP
jgi:hypothetical protein